MNNGGYILINCGHMDLTAESTQTISGIYDKFITAINTGKPIIAENCDSGDNAITSMSVSAWIDSTNDDVIAVMGGCIVTIADDDYIDIVPFATPSEQTKTATAKKTTENGK